ncbi:MAG: outer membrane beta-barrel protein [Bacteroidota bacterium]
MTGFCQGQSLNIVVKENEKTFLTGAIVQITNVFDSEKLVRATDLTGIARFDRLKEGLYTVNISYIGFQPLEASVNITTGQQEFEFRMIEDAYLMNEVIVTARRPVIRQVEDKMIIDPESMASISTNTLEILESTPGLLVDQDGGIYLSSATPAMIFINGREQKMSTQDIMTIMRSLPPSSVKSIEVIRTPSAKYSASTSGGIINVVLKRGVKIGRFGSTRAGMNQGVHGNRFTGFSLNNSGDLSTSYVNFEYSHNDMLEELNSVRLLKSDTSLFQSAQTRRRAHQGYTGYGISYDAGEKVNLSYDGRINGSLPRTAGLNSNVIRDTGGQTISETDNSNSNNSSFLSVMQEFGAVYRIDTAGSEWDTKLSYTFNQNDGTQDYSSGFVFPPANEILGHGDNRQHRHFIQLQSDLTYRLPLNIKMETGFNSTWQYYRSLSDYLITIEGVESVDPLRTKTFSYHERINSTYLQLSRNLGWEVLLKTGIRMEHTFMKGIQSIPSDTSFVINRADLFPYIYLSRPLFSVAGFDLRAYAIYRKTISRPGYESLNPSVNYIDQFFYETGNPGLKPQFTQNFELNISFDDMPIFAIGKSYTRNIFSSVIYQDNLREDVAYRTFDNLGRSTETYFRAMGGIPPTNRYFFYAGAQYNLNEYDGVYESQSLTFRRGSWRFFTYHAFRLMPQTRITMSGFVITKGQMNFYEMDTFGQLNLGLNQTFLDKKLSITLSARDLLRTMVNSFRLNQGNIDTYGDRYSDNRRFGITILFNFGIPEKDDKGKKMSFDIGE